MSTTRKYLTPSEIESVLAFIRRSSPVPVRDYALILFAYRHGLRASEAVSLKWNQINREDRNIFIFRCKKGKNFVHPLQEDELRALTKLNAFYKQKDITSPFIFVNIKLKLQLTRFYFNKLCSFINDNNVVSIKVTPHTFRHSCGYYLANKGYDTRLIQDYLGHKNIQNTEIYTQLAGCRFNVIQW